MHFIATRSENSWIQHKIYFESHFPVFINPFLIKQPQQSFATKKVFMKNENEKDYFLCTM